LSPQPRIDGVDLSPAMVAAARRDCAVAGLAERVTFQVADVAALPHPDTTFDLITSSLSLHHWADPTPASANYGGSSPRPDRSGSTTPARHCAGASPPPTQRSPGPPVRVEAVRAGRPAPAATAHL